MAALLAEYQWARVALSPDLVSLLQQKYTYHNLKVYLKTQRRQSASWDICDPYPVLILSIL